MYIYLLQKKIELGNIRKKCPMCDLSHPIPYDTAIAPVRARHSLHYCVAGPSPLVIIGVTMESATDIRQ